MRVNKKISKLAATTILIVLFQNCGQLSSLKSSTPSNGHDQGSSREFPSVNLPEVESPKSFASHIPACNAASIVQIPESELVLGRMGVNLGPNGCTTNERYTSAVYRHVQNSNGSAHYEYLHNLLEIDQRIDADTTLLHSYDPYPFFVSNKLFAVFECAINHVTEGTSVNVCVAEIDQRTYKINPTNIKILIREVISNGQRLTAAVPKILSHPDGTFIYWATVRVGADGHFLEVSSRGTELFLTADQNFVDKNGSRSFRSDAHTTVLTPAPGGSAEIFDLIMGKDGRVYATASISEPGCTHPGAPKSDCYRLSLLSTDQPIAHDTFKNNSLAHDIPLHTHEYSRFNNWGEGTFISLQFVVNPYNSMSDPNLNGKYMNYLISEDDFFNVKNRLDHTRSALTPDYQSVVERVFLSVLQRPVDAAGLNFYVSLMQNGFTEESLIDDLMASSEYQNLIGAPRFARVVRGLYLDVLRREADTAGLNHYASLMEQGHSELQIRSYLMESGEFRSLPQKVRLEGHVKRAYLSVLQRPADGAGLDFYTSLMEKGHSEDQITSYLMQSQEYKDLTAL